MSEEEDKHRQISQWISELLSTTTLYDDNPIRRRDNLIGNHADIYWHSKEVPQGEFERVRIRFSEAIVAEKFRIHCYDTDRHWTPVSRIEAYSQDHHMVPIYICNETPVSGPREIEIDVQFDCVAKEFEISFAGVGHWVVLYRIEVIGRKCVLYRE